ncbi:hypothetical protein NL676_010184 [Syzygium grande]|nr:hypothetical protein NL676_010184 [Syzygium grande]
MMAIRHPGFSFQPTDEDLFFHYLLRRLNQEPLPDPDVVVDCDVYGGGDPWNIFDKDWDEKFYVFTVLKKKNKSRVDRTAGSGTWKGEQSHEIRDSRGKLVGYKNSSLSNRKPARMQKLTRPKWALDHETECVLCVISNKYARKVNKRECRKLRGLVQLQEENRPAKKAHLLYYDHPNAVDEFSTALPPSAPAPLKINLPLSGFRRRRFFDIIHLPVC